MARETADNGVKSLSDRELLEAIYGLLLDGAQALALYQNGNKPGAWRAARRVSRQADAVSQGRA